MEDCLPKAITGSTTFSADGVWMMTNCQERTGSVSDRPVSAWVKRTFMEGRRESTITFEMVASARIILLPRECSGYATSESGSTTQASPRLPENMQREE